MKSFTAGHYYKFRTASRNSDSEKKNDNNKYITIRRSAVTYLFGLGTSYVKHVIKSIYRRLISTMFLAVL